MSDGLGVDAAVAAIDALRHQLLGALLERRRRRPGGWPTRLQEFLLLTVGVRGAMPVSDVAPLLEVAPATASQLLTTMEQKGWLERAILPADRRRHRVALTPEGEALLERLEGRRRQRLAAVLSGFSDEERALLVALGRRLAAALAQQDDASEGI